MRMRFHVLASIGALLASPLAFASAFQAVAGPGKEPLPTKGMGLLRGKGKQAKPRKRPNMRHISKRVRRKHRRAA